MLVNSASGTFGYFFGSSILFLGVVRYLCLFPVFLWKAPSACSVLSFGVSCISWVRSVARLVFSFVNLPSGVGYTMVPIGFLIRSG